MPRLNERVLNPPEKDRTTFVGLVGRVSSVDAESVSSWKGKFHPMEICQSEDSSCKFCSPHKLPELSSADMGASFAATLKYIGHSELSPLSVWVIADLESERGRKIVGEALEHLENSRDARFAFVHNNRDNRVGEFSFTAQSCSRLSDA